MPTYTTTTTTSSSSTLPTDPFNAPPRFSALTKDLLQAGSELLGTFIFIFVSLGAVQAAIKTQGDAFNLTVATAFGVALTLAVSITYRISGGVLNPAITFALYLLNLFELRKSLLYATAQVIGASLATGAVALLFPGDFKGANQILDDKITVLQVIGLETLLTALLVLVVLFLAVEKSRVTFLAPVFIGFTVFVAHLVLIPYDNTSLNPARSFAGSLAAGIWADHWVFWVGPLLGGAAAAGVYKFFKYVDYEELNPNQDASSNEHKRIILV
ncbi:aquaporin-like protein [Polychytrium aggregatum]|uniref:aquaporin-like protein n=1 Tax=Polychytrium aggregatum TaxID=110093 RepID=UPI0022FEC162|nr:aquaporin-like protein [Polychytrium aggregatum]KAI9199713.1 aquaporin-like protein [Polychytrium aggregatum]